MEHGAVKLRKLSSNETFKQVNYLKITLIREVIFGQGMLQVCAACVVTGQYSNLLFNIHCLIFY